MNSSSIAEFGRLREWGAAVRRRFSKRRFRLTLTFYQRDCTYSLALASLAAYAKQEIPDIDVALVSVVKGDDVSGYVGQIVKQRPDLIAVSAMHPTWLPMLPYLEALRAALPETPVIVGGYQAIFSPEETIRHPAVDCVCVGDGEFPLVSLIRRLRDEGAGDGPISGLWEKRSPRLPAAVVGEVAKTAPVLTQNLSAMPFPDYSIFEKEGGLRWLSPHAIESKGLTTMPVMSGRGCPYRCTYCSNTALLDLFRGEGNILRKYDPDKFVEELVRLKDLYRIEYFQFMDETFLYDKKYARRLLARYSERVGLPFSMFTRIEQMDEDFCRLAAQAGCHSMWFGVESGSEDYRRRYLGRQMTNDRIIAAGDMARRHGIKRMIFNMVGMPFETRDDIVQTIELTRRIDPELATFGQFLPLPGTPLYRLAEDAGLLLPPSAHQQMWTLGDLNIKEHGVGIPASEFRQLVDEILDYLWENNVYDEPQPQLHSVRS